VLARQVLKLPEPVRGGRGPIPLGAEEIPRAPTISAEVAEEAEVEPDNVAHDVSRSKGVRPNTGAILTDDPQHMGLWAATRYIMSIRTNVLMIISSACAYFYLTGVQTFGAELVQQQYGVNQALANLLILVLGVGAVLGVLLGGRLGDGLLRRRFLNGRVFVAALASTAATAAFVPALLTHRSTGALPYLVVAAFGLSAQNPPISAARLDIMPPALWGRAEGIRTFLRTAAQALAPVLFGAMSDTVFHGRHNSLQLTFIVMLAPLAASALLLWRSMGSYPRDVATAAAAAAR
jgi:MFS family permease